MLIRIWRRLKVWRRFPLGPVSLVYRFDRRVRVTKGLRVTRPTGGNQQEEPVGGQLRTNERNAAEDQPNLRPLAVLVGVGPGFGYELSRHLAAEGFDLVLVCRNASSLAPLIDHLHELGASAEAFGADATDESAIDHLFNHIAANHACPSLVVYSVQYFSPGLAIRVEVPAFEAAWRHNCLGAFLVGRQAAQAMELRKEGTIIFVGSTSSIVGRAEHLNLAVGKFGQRAIAQVLARELWSKGVHVAHVIIDADIQDDDQEVAGHPQSKPQDIARSILHLHRQPRTAWTSEMDLRPWNESFWEHC